MPSAIKKLIIIEIYREPARNRTALTQLLFHILKDVQYNSMNDIEAKQKLSILFKSIILGYNATTHYIDITTLQQYFRNDGSPKYVHTDLGVPFPKYKKWHEGVEEIKIYYYIDQQLQVTFKSKIIANNERSASIRFRRRRDLPHNLIACLIRF